MKSAAINLQNKIKNYLKFEKENEIIKDVRAYYINFKKHILELRKLLIAVGFKEEELTASFIINLCKRAAKTTLLNKKII